MNTNIQTVDPTNVVTLTNKTLTTPVFFGTPSSAGQLGRDATQKAMSSFDNGMVGRYSKVIAAGVGTQTLINSTGSDQDFTTLIQFPANTIFTNKVFNVTYLVEFITGVSAVTVLFYLKLGSTKIISSNPADLTNSSTLPRVIWHQFAGRDAAGASASVTGAPMNTPNYGLGQMNTINQPVTGLATNGTLDLIFGLTYSGTGSTESAELQGWVVEELN